MLCTQFHTRRSRSPRSSLHHRTYTAPLSFMQDHTPHTPFRLFRFPLTARGGLAARTAPFSCSGSPPFSWPAVLSSYVQRIAPRATSARMHARSLAHARTTDERTKRRAVQRPAGVADWETSLGGNTERTLTAAAGPSPRDPYRHALTMRPPRKARPFGFLNYYCNTTEQYRTQTFWSWILREDSGDSSKRNSKIIPESSESSSPPL